ncbi:MAG: 4'-phosphopantetheinyl transferase superfamily protein [Elusimicrobiaceae bacterium]
MTQLPPPESILAEGELAVYARFKIEKRKTDWLAGRAAAKLAVQKALDLRFCQPKDISIIPDINGRPHAYIKGVKAAMDISITHSGKTALCAAGAQCLGIDLEKAEPRSRAWAEFAFRGEELADLSPKPLTALWALKEAVLKAAGLGLKAALNDIRFTSAPEDLKTLPVIADSELENFCALGKPIKSPEITGGLADRPELAGRIKKLSYMAAATESGFILAAAWS